MGRIGKAFAWSVAEQFGVKTISLVTQIVLARLLAPSEFGVLAILLMVVNIADTIAQSGFGAAIIQKENASQVTYSSAFWVSISLALAFYVVLFFSSPLIASFYGNEELELYLHVISVALILNSFNSIQRSILQKRLDFKSLFMASFLATACAGAAGIVMAVMGFGVWSLIAQVIANSFFSCITMALNVRWVPKLQFDATEAKELFRFGWKLALTGILNTLNSGISELVVGKACSTEMLGYYSQGRKYPITVMGSMSNALCNVLFPAFAELQSDIAALRRAAVKSLVMGSSLLVPSSVLLVVAAEPLVGLLLSDKWLPSVPIFQMTCLVYAFLLLQVVNLRVYAALGYSAVYLRVHVVKVVLGLVIVPMIAIATRDIYLVAMATTAIDIITILFVDIAPAKRILGISGFAQLKLIAPVYAASALSALPASAILVLDIGYVPLLVVQIAVFACAYVALAKAFRIDGFFLSIRHLKTVLPGRKRIMQNTHLGR